MTTKISLHPGKKDWRTFDEIRERFSGELDFRKQHLNEWANTQPIAMGEIYQILKDGRIVAQFSEGQPDRHGHSMHYAEFIREFTSFVLAWQDRIDTGRLGYRVIAGKQK